MELTDLALDDEQFNDVDIESVKKDFPKTFFGKPIDELTSQRTLAEIEFVKNEVEILGLIRNGNVLPDQGHAEPILVGSWKYEDGVYVRAGVDSKALIVYNPYESWSFDIRTDCEEQAFFYRWNTSRGQSSIAPKTLQRAINVTNRVTQAVRGYEQVMLSRNPLSSE